MPYVVVLKILLPDFLLPAKLKIKILTPRKTNMSPENQWLEDVFPIEIVPF